MDTGPFHIKNGLVLWHNIMAWLYKPCFRMVYSQLGMWRHRAHGRLPMGKTPWPYYGQPADPGADSNVQPGQVRVLRGLTRLLTVLVVGKWTDDGDLWTVMSVYKDKQPKGRQECLCESGELVLAGWSTWSLDVEILKKTKCIGTVQADTLDKARHLFRAFLGVEDYSDIEGTGVSLEYLEETDPEVYNQLKLWMNNELLEFAALFEEGHLYAEDRYEASKVTTETPMEESDLGFCLSELKMYADPELVQVWRNDKALLMQGQQEDIDDLLAQPELAEVSCLLKGLSLEA